MSRTNKIDELAQRLDIRQLRYKYSEYYDNREWDKWVNLFTDDVVFDAREVPGREIHRGKEEFIEFVSEHSEEARPYEIHLALQPRITLDGDEASGRWILNIVSVESDGTVWWLGGEYIDEYRLVSDEWKFSSVKVVIDAQASSTDVNFDIFNYS
jgi:hypothetical protein